MYPVCYSFFGTLFSKGQLSAELTQVAPEPKPLSLAEEDLLADITYDELKGLSGVGVQSLTSKKFLCRQNDQGYILL